MDTTHGSAWMPHQLRPLLETPGVTDVLVNGPSEAWIDRGLGLERADARFASSAEVREVAVRLATIAGRRLDDAQPTVDARLPDGTRLHAVLPPVADAAPLLSLRLLRSRAPSLADLELAGSVGPAERAELERLVRRRASMLVTGATGSGKTTLVSSLLSLADPTERIVLIEEAGELAPTHPHVVRLIERRPNVDGAGGVPLATLVREALRMRPDRIVLGEARGPEMREVLVALNTGHGGGMVTMHANSAAEAPVRLVALGALAGMSPEATALHAAAAFDAVVHLERRAGLRRVASIGALDYVEGRLRIVPWRPVGAVPIRNGSAAAAELAEAA